MKIKGFLRRIKYLLWLLFYGKNSAIIGAVEECRIKGDNESIERQNELFVLLNKKCRREGFELYNIGSYWLEDETFKSILSDSPDQKQRIDRKYVLWQFALSAAKLDGYSAECGVYKGAGSYLIGRAFEGKKAHKHYIFDSFEGLSEPHVEDEVDFDVLYKWKKGDLSVGLEKVRKNLNRFDFFEYFQGWIPTQFHHVADKKFSLVHVDVDLYEPTKDSLLFFYDRLVPGGILLCDDYGSLSCQGAKKAFDELALEQNLSVVGLPTQQGFIIKPNRLG